MDKKRFKLGIIDEDESEVEEFFRFFEEVFEPIKIELVNDKQGIIQHIIDKQVDAVVIDYKLMEHGSSSLTFNGNELLQDLNNRLYNFPAFIMTNYPPDARNHRIDPFRIVSKDFMQPDESKPEYYKVGQELIKTIKTLIKNYKDDLAEKEKRLLELINKRNREGKLSDFEEEEMVELDTFLEKSIDMRSRLPKKWKRPEEASKLDELIKDTQELIGELKRKKNE
jgi:hypothetical protein